MRWELWCYGIVVGGALAPVSMQIARASTGRSASSRMALMVTVSMWVTATCIFAQDWSALTTITWLVFLLVGEALALIDAQERRLPDALTLPLLALALLLLALDATQHGWQPLTRGIYGAFGLFATYLVLHLVSRGGVGMGDVKFAPAVGLLAAHQGWVQFAEAVLLAFVAGGIVSIWLLASGRGSRKATLPFGPFMVFGIFAMLPLVDVLRPLIAS